MLPSTRAIPPSPPKWLYQVGAIIITTTVNLFNNIAPKSGEEEDGHQSRISHRHYQQRTFPY